MQVPHSAGDIQGPEPEARYRGRDGSGLVQVEVDGAARHVAVLLAPGWRRTIGGPGLGAAVLAAFGAASTARLTAWAERAADRRQPDGAPASAMVASQAQRPPEVIASLAQAWRDLREYQLRLTELSAAAGTTAGPGRNVVVTVRAGQIAGIVVAPDWVRTATDTDVERATGQTLRAALDDLARLPERALEGCPALRAVLAAQQAAPLHVPPVRRHPPDTDR